MGCFYSQHPAGTSNLWELVSVVMGLDDSLLSANYSKGIMHVRHLSRVKAVCIKGQMSRSHFFKVVQQKIH